MIRPALTLLALSMFAVSAFAIDVIELKGGGTIRGEIVEESDTIVIIKPTFGGSIELERSRILSISQVAASDVEDKPTDASKVEDRAGYLLYDRARALKGYQVIRRLRRDDAIIFETETMFFGGEKEPRLWLNIHEECGPDLEPRSFVYREKVGDAAEFLRTGRIVEGRLEITEVRRGEERKRSMLAPAALRFASAARREIFKRPDSLADDGVEITVFDPIQGEPVTERWTRVGSESVEWERKAIDATVFRVMRRGAASEWRVTATGMVLAAELNGPHVTIVRVPFETASWRMRPPVDWSTRTRIRAPVSRFTSPGPRGSSRPDAATGWSSSPRRRSCSPMSTSSATRACRRAPNSRRSPRTSAAASRARPATS